VNLAIGQVVVLDAALPGVSLPNGVKITRDKIVLVKELQAGISVGEMLMHLLF
jgi:hypothetical protein